MKTKDELLAFALQVLEDRGAAPVARLAAHRLVYMGDRKPFQELVTAARLAETDSGDGLESPSGVEGDGA